MRPDIAQAIHDAAVSERLCYIAETEEHILTRVFLSNSEFWDVSGKHFSVALWLRTDEGRTYMLLVAEALS
jgi:hypothetical protein